MAAVKNFEELTAWKKARETAGYVYALTRKPGFSRDFGLRDQIQRAASSMMHNIAEGFEAGYDPEFVRFLRIARRNFILRWTPVTSTPRSFRLPTH